ncbi:uncharacterized protein isoform X2 [Choristoneura fumiferana]|uniref:uncharacterized protein isoform X2 n=1 Tax=Choristoneura fumiferana TaxID=7141 RepID=UPI003D154D34
MSKTQAWQASFYVKESSPYVSSTECHLTPVFGILLRISRCMGVAPVRLRWCRGNSLIEVSRELVVFQRLIMILSSILLFIGVGYDFISNNHVRVGTAIFTAALWITEICLGMSICLIRAFKAPGTVDRLIILLKQINKINHGLNHGVSKVRCLKFGKLKLSLYMIGTFLLRISDFIWFQLNVDNPLVVTLYACFYYQDLSVQIIQLELALVMAQMTSLVVGLNDHLHRLLQSISQNSDDVVNSKYRYLTIRQLAQYHEQICDMVKAVDEDSGPILLLSFMLVFLQLLITPYNLMAIVMHKRTELIIQQSCWSIFHLTSLLVLVEPCHWMQDQMDHTRYLLTRLARRSADGDERFFKELELFILQIQMKGAVIAPMGVFTISRSLVASIIGSVTTYLAIIIQMHDVNEML